MADNTLKIPCNTCSHRGICKCENDVLEFAQKIAEIQDQYRLETIESVYFNCYRYIESKQTPKSNSVYKDMSLSWEAQQNL